MKTTAIFMALLWASFSLQSATHTVDNVFPGANFSSISAALSAANSGDTILVQPSPVNYGAFTISKKIYIKGPGHRSGWANMGAEIQKITFNGGHDSSTVDGFTIRASPSFQGSTHRYISFLNNIFLQNNQLVFGTSVTAQHIVVQGNIFWRSFHANTSLNCGSSTSHSWLITNNLFLRTTASTTSNGIIENLHPTSVFEYNTIVSSVQGSGVFSVFQNTSNAVIRNNIFYLNGSSYTTVASNCSNCTFEYNLQFNPIGTLTPLSGTGNLNNVDPQIINLSSVYNNNSSSVWAYNADYNLQTSSPANTASSNNGRIGVTGGLGHFHHRGFSAAFPVITQAIPQNRIVPQGDSIIIRVEGQRGGL